MVADDRSLLHREDDRIVVRAPQTIRNNLEVRGIGVVRIKAEEPVHLVLVVDLDGPSERFPEPETAAFLGLSIPFLRLNAFESSAPAKIRLAVRMGPDDIVR